jgi:hypothetical protein
MTATGAGIAGERGVDRAARGAVAHWGGGKYHVEFKPDHDKKEATVWILGSDEKTAVPIKAKDGQILASITGLKTKDLRDGAQGGLPEGRPGGQGIALHRQP